MIMPTLGNLSVYGNPKRVILQIQTDFFTKQDEVKIALKGLKSAATDLLKIDSGLLDEFGAVDRSINSAGKQFAKIWKLLPTLPKLSNVTGLEQLTPIKFISIANRLATLLADFKILIQPSRLSGRTKRETFSYLTFPSVLNTGLIKPNSVVGCSLTESMAPKNRVSCLLKYLKITRRPVHQYVGSDLLSLALTMIGLRSHPINNPVNLDSIRTALELTFEDGQLLRFRLRVWLKTRLLAGPSGPQERFYEEHDVPTSVTTLILRDEIPDRTADLDPTDLTTVANVETTNPTEQDITTSSAPDIVTGTTRTTTTTTVTTTTTTTTVTTTTTTVTTVTATTTTTTTTITTTTTTTTTKTTVPTTIVTVTTTTTTVTTIPTTTKASATTKTTISTRSDISTTTTTTKKRTTTVVTKKTTTKKTKQTTSTTPLNPRTYLPPISELDISLNSEFLDRTRQFDRNEISLLEEIRNTYILKLDFNTPDFTPTKQNKDLDTVWWSSSRLNRPTSVPLYLWEHTESPLVRSRTGTTQSDTENYLSDGDGDIPDTTTAATSQVTKGQESPDFAKVEKLLEGTFEGRAILQIVKKVERLEKEIFANALRNLLDLLYMFKEEISGLENIIKLRENAVSYLEEFNIDTDQLMIEKVEYAEGTDHLYLHLKSFQNRTSGMKFEPVILCGYVHCIKGNLENFISIEGSRDLGQLYREEDCLIGSGRGDKTYLCENKYQTNMCLYFLSNCSFEFTSFQIKNVEVYLNTFLLLHTSINGTKINDLTILDSNAIYVISSKTNTVLNIDGTSVAMTGTSQVLPIHVQKLEYSRHYIDGLAPSPPGSPLTQRWVNSAGLLLVVFFIGILLVLGFCKSRSRPTRHYGERGEVTETIRLNRRLTTQ